MSAATLTLSVVFGSGPLGLAVVDELAAAGRSVRLVNRSGKATVPRGVEVAAADATDARRTRDVCLGAAVVYHCANPPYTRWPQEFPALQRGILAGAASAGARLVFGDNLYMYGPVDGPLTEDLPSRATGPNGRTRAEMAAMLMDAHARGDVRVAIGRGSDFYGPRVLLSAAGERVFGAALKGKAAQVLGDPDAPHTFTYIHDFARALVLLADRDQALGHVWHVPSGESLTTREFVTLVFEIAGRRPRLSAAPRALVSILAPFSPVMRALKEQLYQFERPFVMDSNRFTHTFGDLATPHRDAVRETLAWYRSHAVAH